MKRFRCAGDVIEMPLDLVALASERFLHRNFVAGSGAVALRIERVTSLPVDRRFCLEGSPAPWGFHLLADDVLQVEIPDDKWAAESVLRIAWQVSTFRQGGVLMHGCGFAWGEQGIAAVGQSTAGKSTLARLSCGPPGGATLLSDEIVQLFPDGRLFGTPFRSDNEAPGAPGGVVLRHLLLLEKGDREALTPLAPAAVLPDVLGQLYRGTNSEIAQAEIVRRVLRLVDACGVSRLTFRRSPAVGPFLRNRLAPPAG